MATVNKIYILHFYKWLYANSSVEVHVGCAFQAKGQTSWRRILNLSAGVRRARLSRRTQTQKSSIDENNFLS